MKSVVKPGRNFQFKPGDDKDVELPPNLRKPDYKWIIRANDPKRINWDLVIMVFAIFNCLVIPIEIAFEPAYAKTWWYLIFNSTIDFSFFLDILVTFRTTYFSSTTGNEVYNPKYIAINYIKG